MVVLIFFAFLEESECIEAIGRRKNGLVSTFPFLHASNAKKPHPIFPITTQASYRYKNKLSIYFSIFWVFGVWFEFL